jgi:hypothetical protein
MKNKFTALTLMIITVVTLASCASSRSGYYNGGHRKGYGCPATSFHPVQSVEESKI